MRRLLLAFATAIVAVGATVGSTQASIASGWTIVRTPNPVSSSLHFGALNAVSCANTTACMAVGSGVNDRANQSAIAEAWNGTAWTMLHTARVRGAASAALAAVSCTAVDACTAVGYQEGGAGMAVPLVERWNGTIWSVQQSQVGRGGSLTGVSCVSATACMAVGITSDAAGFTATLAEQWDGVSWNIVPTPKVAHSFYAVLSAVSCSAADACTAVGSTTAAGFGTVVERWNGTSWAFESMAIPSDGQEGFATGVSCTSATSCVAAGDYINDSFTYVTLAEGWNGTAWTVQASPNPTGEFLLQVTGLSCSSGASCTAVGWTDAGAMVLRLRGGAWKLEPTPPPSGAPLVTQMLNSVSCSSGSACMSVGSFAGTFAEGWNGSSWALESTQNTPGVLTSQLAAVACGTATACIGVGSQETAAGGEVSLAESWNGSAWSIQATPRVTGALTVALTGVACTASTACTAVGWDDSTAGTREPLAERWNGHVWSVQPMPAPSGAGQSSLSGVACASAIMCVAVGSSQNAAGRQTPLVERWNGSAWTIVRAPMPADALQGRLTSISCTSITACVTVGEYLNGAILVGRGHAHQPMADVWNGASWAAESIDRPVGAAASYLDAVSCSTSTSCVAVGWSTGASKTQTAMAELWSGSGWTVEPSASAGSSVLSGVSCVTSTACTAVGTSRAGATIAERWNGTAWAMQATPNRAASPRAFSGVDCVSATSCTAVGSALGTAGYTVTLAERYSG